MAKKGERKVSGSVALDSAEPTPEGKIAVLEAMHEAGVAPALDITPETGFAERPTAATRSCATCGNPVALGAACVVDGTVAA